MPIHYRAPERGKPLIKTQTSRGPYGRIQFRHRQNLPSFAAFPKDIAVDKVALPEVPDELAVLGVHANESTYKEIRHLLDRGMNQVPEDPNREDG